MARDRKTVPAVAAPVEVDAPPPEPLVSIEAYVLGTKSMTLKAFAHVQKLTTRRKLTRAQWEAEYQLFLKEAR